MMSLREEAETFYKKLLSALLAKKVPFMVGGTYAFTAYTGIRRATKDFDFMTSFDDYPKILQIAHDMGYHTKISDPNWVAKIHSREHFADVIFAEKNGLRQVDKAWYKRARLGNILGFKVKLVPIEEVLTSKAYIQHRERHDGADVVHLILKQGKNIDWKLLLAEMEPHWQILLGHLLVFIFVYPSERSIIPKWVMKQLLERTKKESEAPVNKNKITRGLLISSQYTVGVTKWGFKPVQEFKKV